MKKFLKTLVVGLCLFTLLCCALPAAFAADKISESKKEENVYAIGMDAQGGICSTVVTYTNLSVSFCDFIFNCFVNFVCCDSTSTTVVCNYCSVYRSFWSIRYT